MNNIFLILIGCFAVIGAIDYILGNQWGMGDQFAEGFLCMGPTALSIVGIICIIPLLKDILTPIVQPISSILGFDPAMFGSLLANNMGGYTLATELAIETQLGKFSGLIVSSMLGATLVYSIPVGLGIIKTESHPAFAKGIMIGMITIPIGSIVGGWCMGLNIFTCLINIFPILILSIGISIGFKLNERFILKCFTYFSKGLNMIGILSLGLAAFQSISGINIFHSIDDIYVGLQVVAEMSVMQLGTLPLIAILIKIFKKPLTTLGEKMGISATATAGLITSCINAISVFTMMNKMSEKDIMIVSSFLVSMICIFTAHFSFTAAISVDLVIPMILAKFVSGLSAVIIAMIVCRKSFRMN